MLNSDSFDVIIVGTGAGGGTLVRRLAPTGKRILILERGDYIPREKDNWDAGAVNLRGKYQTKESWRDKDGAELHPHTNYCVGGNTKFYGAALFRLRKEDFSELRHHGGLSPAWPVGYDEFEPYYTEGALRCPRPAGRGPYRTAPQQGLSPPPGDPRTPYPAIERRLCPARTAPIPHAPRRHAERIESAGK